MKAWHSSPRLKAEVLTRMLQHRAADSIIQGQYQVLDPNGAMGYRGCLIGCTLPLRTVSGYDGVPDNWHQEVEDQYGIPEEIAILLDYTFERLTVDKAPWFAVTFIEATPVGADMDKVVEQLKQDLVDQYHEGVLPLWIEFNDPDWLCELCQFQSTSFTAVSGWTAEFLWVAEQIIKRVQEADPSPYVQPVIAYDTAEETHVLVAA